MRCKKIIQCFHHFSSTEAGKWCSNFLDTKPMSISSFEGCPTCASKYVAGAMTREVGVPMPPWLARGSFFQGRKTVLRGPPLPRCVVGFSSSGHRLGWLKGTPEPSSCLHIFFFSTNPYFHCPRPSGPFDVFRRIPKMFLRNMGRK